MSAHPEQFFVSYFLGNLLKYLVSCQISHFDYILKQVLKFSLKRNKPHHPDIIFNCDPVKQRSYQKHSEMFLDSKLDFDEHIKGVFGKARKSISLIRMPRNFLPRSSYLQIYKSIVTPYLDYGDIIYDKAMIGSFQQTLESIQYNAALAIKGAIRGTSTKKIYSGLGLESLQDRC